MSAPAHSYEIDAEEGWVVIAYQVLVTAESAMGLLLKIAADPAWRSGYARLLIYDGGEYGEFDPEAMRALAAGVAELRKSRETPEAPPTAHVCADPIKRTVVHHWLAVINAVDRTDTELFASRSQAEDWLRERRAAG